MGFADFMLGSRPNYRYMPGVEGIMNEVRGINPKLGYAGRMAKKNLKLINSGADVSSLGALNSIAQAGATERRGIEEGYMTAGNALLAMNPDNAALINSMRDNQMNRSRERQGMNLVSGLNDLRNSETNTYENARANKNNLLMSKYGLLSNLNQQQYDNRRTGGQLGNIIGGALGGLTSFATGGMSGMFGKKPPTQGVAYAA